MSESTKSSLSAPWLEDEDSELIEDSLQLAMVESETSDPALSFLDKSILNNPAESLEEPNPGLEATRGGYGALEKSNFGHQAQVDSVARDLNLPSPNRAFDTDDIFHPPVNVVEAFSAINGTTFPPPPAIIPTPNVSINDTKVNNQDISVFTLTLSDAQISPVSVAFQHPSDVKVIGGTGLTSVDDSLREGIVTFPAGTTSVTLAFELLLTSTLEPGDQFEVMISDDNQGLVPIFVKELGIANLPTESTSTTFATDDIFWTALQDTHNYNVTFVIDISGSMNKGIETGQSRLDKAKIALVDFIDLYDSGAENLNIHIIPFGSDDNNQAAFVYNATSVEDAKDFVLKENAHADDGLAIGMINPNTGDTIGRGTQYNDALYHARITLEEDIVNPNLADYAPQLYFFSDGRPNPNHGTTDTNNWPASWSPWVDFIEDPKSEVPNSFADTIDAYAISLGLNPSIASALQSLVLDPVRVFAVDDDLTNLNDQLLTTVPEYFQGNILENDNTNLATTKVVEITLPVNNASQFIIDHHLTPYGANAIDNDSKISIPLPQSGDNIKLDTPLGGSLMINDQGDFFYLPPKLQVDGQEVFGYHIRDDNTHDSDNGLFTFNIISDTNGYHALEGDTSNNTLSTTGLSGVVTMTGQEGDNTFVIDLGESLPQTIVIRDLFDNPNNTLQFLDTLDSNLDAQLTLADVLTDVQQSGPGATLALSIDHDGQSSTLYLDNPGPYTSLNLTETLLFLDNQVHVEL